MGNTDKLIKHRLAEIAEWKIITNLQQKYR